MIHSLHWLLSVNRNRNNEAKMKKEQDQMAILWPRWGPLSLLLQMPMLMDTRPMLVLLLAPMDKDTDSNSTNSAHCLHSLMDGMKFWILPLAVHISGTVRAIRHNGSDLVHHSLAQAHLVVNR